MKSFMQCKSHLHATFGYSTYIFFASKRINGIESGHVAVKLQSMLRRVY